MPTSNAFQTIGRPSRRDFCDFGMKFIGIDYWHKCTYCLAINRIWLLILRGLSQQTFEFTIQSVARFSGVFSVASVVFYWFFCFLWECVRLAFGIFELKLYSFISHLLRTFRVELKTELCWANTKVGSEIKLAVRYKGMERSHIRRMPQSQTMPCNQCSAQVSLSNSMHHGF